MLVDMNMESTVKQPVAKRAYEGDNGANVRQNLEQLLKVLKFSTSKRKNLAQVLKRGRYFKSKATQNLNKLHSEDVQKAAKRMANKKALKEFNLQHLLQCHQSRQNYYHRSCYNPHTQVFTKQQVACSKMTKAIQYI